jgi:hypothetical protein
VINLKDDQGRTLKSMGMAMGDRNPLTMRQQTFSFERPQDAKTLTATIGVSRVVTVEFNVKLVLAGSGAPP